MPQHVDNHERWLVSYADFITLLFALFVVMYATSLANVSTVGVLTTSILEAFNLPNTIATIDPESAEIGDLISAEDGPAEATIQVPLRLPLEALGTGEPMPIPPEIAAISERVEGSLGELEVAEDVGVRRTSLWVEIEIPSDMVFPSGSRVLLNDAIPVLDRIAAGLRGIDNRVGVQAHTDDQFIDNGLFVSNWELSAARASAVVRYLIQGGIAPERLSATGFAGFRPIADNGTEEGRRENQRLVLRIPALSVSKTRALEEQAQGSAGG
jgi:chemotaxis protein MotB